MDEIRERVNGVIASGRYVGGPEVDALEANLCHLTGAKCAVGVSNGLDALRLILRGYIAMEEMSAGDEVIVPANTYIASVLAISDAGLVPVLAEPDAATSNLDFTLLESLVTPRTRAIMPVHLYGRVCYSPELHRLAEKYGLKIIEDNAQAIGASILTADGLRVFTGNLGDAAAISFYPTKNIGAMGDAGAVLTSDERLAQTVRALANYGSDVRYHNIYKGFNCRLDPIQAAVLNVKLPHVAQENAYRRRLASIYFETLKDSPAVASGALRLPRMPADPEEMVWHQYVVHAADRQHLISELDRLGIRYDIHYATPPHRQPCYDGVFPGSFPVTDLLAASCLSLPITRTTSEEDAHRIAQLIAESDITREI